MKRTIAARCTALLLCLLLLACACPAQAITIDETLTGIGSISAKVLEYCMMEHETELTFYLPKSVVQRLTDDQIKEAIWDALDEYCMEGYTTSRRVMDDGRMRVWVRNISLRSGLLMVEAYYNGITTRLSYDEKRCLRQIEQVVDNFVRQYGLATVDTELAIYDYICDHVEYRNYPSSDSRRKQCTSAANAFLYGWGNCQAYSDLFFMMTTMAGFDAGYVSGNSDDGSGHLWNTIGIGDDLYMVDVTFGDNSNDYYPRHDHYYFNFGRDRSGDHVWSAEILNPNHIAKKTNDKYTYYSHKNSRYGQAVKNLSEAAKYCVSEVKKGNKYVEVLVKTSVKDDNAVNKAIKKALGKAQGEWKFSYKSVDGNFLLKFNWVKYKNKKVK